MGSGLLPAVATKNTVAMDSGPVSEVRLPRFKSGSTKLCDLEQVSPSVPQFLHCEMGILIPTTQSC